MQDYGSGGWGFEFLAARHDHRSSAALWRVAECCQVAGPRPYVATTIALMRPSFPEFSGFGLCYLEAAAGMAGDAARGLG